MSVLYANKIPHPDNFVFARGAAVPAIRALGSDVFQLTGRRRWRNPSQARLARRLPGPDAFVPAWRRDGTLQLKDAAGKVVLAGAPRATFGRCGAAWMLQFRHEPGMQFYGLGEHSRGFEKSGQRVKFWNTDAIGDYNFDQVRQDYADPMYVSVPWVVVKQGNFYVGLLVNHPGEVFMDLASNFIWASGNDDDRDRRSFYLGAPDGEPDVYLVVGPDLAALTRKLQALVGRTPLPPRWALGYQQCRWGYAGKRDLNWLDRELRRRGFPCDGLWLDIDYMERYKVFTFAPQHWGGPREVRRTLADLRRRGRRVVPILDPGIKRERGYSIYEEGLRQRQFCLNPAGTPFVGFAWPGHIVMPDYSRRDGREWWAKHVAEFVRHGVGGVWIDMNDPAVGSVPPYDMRFNRGRAAHDTYHNQYALGMAEATRDGFLAARPDERPFILTRSAFISSSRHAAVWTGDNFSNWHHLRLAVSVTLGLGMSGLPFCGADVGGFAINATRDLMIAWYKASFLFPFFRNHCASAQFVRGQEPWTFGRSAERILAHYVRLRYKFLPYLYQLFVAQEAAGDAILRPLLHDFSDRPALPLAQVGDQFMVGPGLMQAPVVEEGKQRRDVVLPGRDPWYSLDEGRWIEGGRRRPATSGENDTPLYARAGALLPLRAGDPVEAETDLREIELHVFLPPGSRQVATAEYSADDGLSFAYQRGRRTTVSWTARLARDGTLDLQVDARASGYGALHVRVIAYHGGRDLRLTTAAGTQALRLRPFAWRATGARLRAHASAWIELPPAARR